MKKLILPLLISSFTFINCASINSVSLTQIPAKRDKQIEASREKLIFFAFNFDNEYIPGVVEDLMNQCPGGKITGVLTKDENINYFLYIVWKKRVSLSAFCDMSSDKNSKTKTASLN